MQRTPILAAMILLAAVAAVGPASADEPGPNTRLTFTIDTPAFDNAIPSVVEVAAALDGSVSVVTGARLPIPTSAGTDEGSAENCGVRFSYQHVGLSIQARIRPAEGGRVLVTGTIEVSGLAPGSAPGDLGSPPVVTTASSSFAVTLSDGGSERIVRVSGADGDRLVVDLRVDPLE